jgi:hypothetical protein
MWEISRLSKHHGLLSRVPSKQGLCHVGAEIAEFWRLKSPREFLKDQALERAIVMRNTISAMRRETHEEKRNKIQKNRQRKVYPVL